MVVGCLPASVVAHRWAVGVGEPRRGMGAAAVESVALVGRLRPPRVAAQVVSLVSTLTALEVRQRLKHGGHPAGGHVDWRAGSRVEEVGGVMMSIGGLAVVGSESQALVHLLSVQIRSNGRMKTRKGNKGSPGFQD